LKTRAKRAYNSTENNGTLGGSPSGEKKVGAQGEGVTLQKKKTKTTDEGRKKRKKQGGACEDRKGEKLIPHEKPARPIFAPRTAKRSRTPCQQGRGDQETPAYRVGWIPLKAKWRATGGTSARGKVSKRGGKVPSLGDSPFTDCIGQKELTMQG